MPHCHVMTNALSYYDQPTRRAGGSAAKQRDEEEICSIGSSSLRQCWWWWYHLSSTSDRSSVSPRRSSSIIIFMMFTAVAILDQGNSHNNRIDKWGFVLTCFYLLQSAELASFLLGCEPSTLTTGLVFESCETDTVSLDSTRYI